jgi:hypothetical protein
VVLKGRCVVASVTNEPKTDVDSLPIDVELISDIADDVLRMELSTSTRDDIDFKTARVVGLLNLLLVEDLGTDDDEEVMVLFRRTYKLLELSNRPSRQTTSFTAFAFLHDVATHTRALLSVYASRNGINVQ